ncbi:hypothetical protein [Cereibacter sphaeroides]|uniref:hypothetical protein n=1 Tax=Cereibacter sphaeroides TaxID=1063 RepID=UPI000AF7C65C|nr:hypothetical protein [Cereibacter sphaeroides]
MVISVRSVEGLERDKLYRVTSTLPYQNSITLRPEGGGAEVALTLGHGSKAAGSLAAFEVGKREFAAGDEVKFAITDKDCGAINGARGRITKVTEAQIDVTLHGGRKLSVPTDSLAARGLDHAYAATAHDFQGATVDRIIVGMTPDEQLTSQKSFYVNISRARDHVTLVTTDPGSSLIGFSVRPANVRPRSTPTRSGSRTSGTRPERCRRMSPPPLPATLTGCRKSCASRRRNCGRRSPRRSALIGRWSNSWRSSRRNRR